MSREPFSRRIRTWLIGAGAASIVASLALAIFGEVVFESRSAGADSFSYSALGHRAFVEYLRDAGHPVVVSRADSIRRAGEDTLVVCAEPLLPDDDGADLARLKSLLRHEGPTLIVLPKWRGVPSEVDSGWISSAELIPIDEVERILEAGGVVGSVARSDARPTFRGPDGARVEAEIDHPQLLRSRLLRPIVASDGGLLVAEQPGSSGTTYWIADPDLLSNHGIGRGDHAELALRIVDDLCGPAGAVMVDETIHGYRLKAQLWRELFRPPLVLATIQAILTLGLLLWSAMPRFGAPTRLAPAIDPGKSVLIDNTAALLASAGGQTAFAVDRYLEMAEREVATRLHAPPGMGSTARRRWLQERSRARGLDVDLDAMAARIEGSRDERRLAALLLARARGIHQWRREMLHAARPHQ